MIAKDRPRVSVLVPIYNVQRYLRQCLDSVVNQTLREIEIICLNDGSTDDSLAIIKEYAKKDDRIVVVDKKNSGYGDSMNQGLKKARGEYIGIVESDDWIDANAFKELYELAKLDDVDVVRANYYQTRAGVDKKFFYIDPVSIGKVINPRQQTWIFLQAPAIWSAIYRRDFLEQNGIDFLPTPGASYQDTGFNFKVWTCAKKARFTTEAFLHYRTDNETSSVKSAGKIMNVCVEYESIERFLKEKGLFNQLGAIMETAKFGAYYWNMLRVSPRLLDDFLKKSKEEYAEARKQNLLFEEYFGDKQKWKLVNVIIDSSLPKIKRKLLWLRLKIRLREAGKRVFFKIRPSYLKQQEISVLISELYSQCDMFEQQIAMLDTKLNAKREDNDAAEK